LIPSANDEPYICRRFFLGRIGEKMTDQYRETKIKRDASGIEADIHEWDQSGCFASRGRADSYRLEMERLINNRSPEQLSSMAVA
jgi:hypothetical protein